MAKLAKIVFIVLLLVINFIPIYSTAQVNYSPKKDKNAESIDRQEERRIEQNRRANERRKEELRAQNNRDSEKRMNKARKQQNKLQSYSVERDIKSRRVKKRDEKLTPEEKLVQKLEKQKQREEAKKDKLAEKERKKMSSSAVIGLRTPKTDSNPNLTAKILISYSIAMVEFIKKQKYGAYTILDVPFKYLTKNYIEFI